jgi:hypothetical protein
MHHVLADDYAAVIAYNTTRIPGALSLRLELPSTCTRDEVECHHSPVGRQRVEQRWIRVIKIAAQVLEQDQRHLARSGVAVGVVDAVSGTDHLVRNCEYVSCH